VITVLHFHDAIIVIVPINGVNQAVIRAVDYARSRADEIRAVMVDVDPESTARIKMQWAQWGCGVNLIALPSPYRSVMGSLLDYIENSGEGTDSWVTVVIPEILPAIGGRASCTTNARCSSRRRCCSKIASS